MTFFTVFEKLVKQTRPPEHISEIKLFQAGYIAT